MRVLLAGEGKTELGEWAKEPAYRDQPPERGVLVALLDRVRADPFTVVDGILWTRIRKYRAGNHAASETRNVLGLALMARRARCDAVVFARDRDGSIVRQRDLEEGIQRAREEFADLKLAGGIAIENIESWVLVLLGDPGESVGPKRTKHELATRFQITTAQQMVDAVASATLERVPEGSLARWLATARTVLA